MLSKVQNFSKGVKLPKSVGGNLSFRSLTSVKELILPENFRGILYLGEQFNEDHGEIIQLRKKYPGLNLDFV